MPSEARARKILLASYGGGHAEIVAVLAKALRARGDDVTVLGLTTAHAALQAYGLNPHSSEDLIVVDEDQTYLEVTEEYCGGNSHPHVTPDQTKAYFAAGIRDLVAEFGWDQAREKVAAEGRMAFLPVTTMMRYIEQVAPDIVIATTSPRFERALLMAARRLSVPSLAVADLFVTNERAWVLKPDYAEYLAVLCGVLAAELVEEGFPATNIRATGNPAFDALQPDPGDAQRRHTLRQQLGVDRKSVVLWPGPGGPLAQTGVAFNTPEEVVTAFEPICRSDPSICYLMRPHPNLPFELPKGAEHGILDDRSLSAEDSILISDVICFNISTMGLQAALRGKPAVAVGFEDYLPYGEYGLATPAASLEDAASIIASGSYGPPADFDMPPLGTACENVLSFVDDILAQS